MLSIALFSLSKNFNTNSTFAALFKSALC
jgi:hypothetical protein